MTKTSDLQTALALLEIGGTVRVESGNKLWILVDGWQKIHPDVQLVTFATHEQLKVKALRLPVTSEKEFASDSISGHIRNAMQAAFFAKHDVEDAEENESRSLEGGWVVEYFDTIINRLAVVLANVEA